MNIRKVPRDRLRSLFGGRPIGRIAWLINVARVGNGGDGCSSRCATRMAKSVEIKKLVAPSGGLSVFDPGAYLANLEFYESDNVISEGDRNGLAQFVDFLAFLALKNRSTGWPNSVVPRSSSAFT